MGCNPITIVGGTRSRSFIIRRSASLTGCASPRPSMASYLQSQHKQSQHKKRQNKESQKTL